MESIYVNCEKAQNQIMLTAYTHAMVPFRNTSLDVRHSTDEVAYFLLSLLVGNFLAMNSGRLCRLLPRSNLVCLVLDLLSWESLSRGRDP